uniref:Uncharacterized protein n=1 Tax=Mustela putorius furo TaxID=9669 RepID=M3Y605_MUSPF
MHSPPASAGSFPRRALSLCPVPGGLMSLLLRVPPETPQLGQEGLAQTSGPQGRPQPGAASGPHSPRGRLLPASRQASRAPEDVFQLGGPWLGFPSSSYR